MRPYALLTMHEVQLSMGAAIGQLGMRAWTAQFWNSGELLTQQLHLQAPSHAQLSIVLPTVSMPHSSGRLAVAAQASPAAAAAAPGKADGTPAAGMVTPMEALRQENQLLKQAITDSATAITELESLLRAAGVPVPEPEGLPEPVPTAPEDYWTPALEVPGG